ncbi:hypothetical protein PC114_g27566, partial [Phytophthora cactorum]
HGVWKAGLVGNITNCKEDGAALVASMCARGVYCIGQCSERQLVFTSKSQSGSVEGLDTSATRVVGSLITVCGVVMSNRLPNLYRDISLAKREMEKKDHADINYSQLTSFLTVKPIDKSGLSTG